MESRRSLLIRVSLILSICVSAQPGISGETIYVQAAKASLKGEAKSTAPATAELSRGAPLNVLEKNGNWLKVETAGKVGWIPKLFTSTHPPIGQADLAGNEKVNAEKASRKRPGQQSVAASARGLMENQRSRQGREQYRLNFQAVDKVEKKAIDPAEAEKFNQETSGNNP
jgi:hypothetical protein